MPTVTPRAVDPEGFAPYGTVVLSPGGPPTAQTDTFRYWSDLGRYHIDGDTEIGLCTVYRHRPARISWIERHDRTPELLIPIDAPFVLPVTAGEDATVEAFRVDVGEAVVIGRGVWHSACHPAEGEQATYFVIFRRGTPHEDVVKLTLDDVVMAQNESDR